MQTQQLPSKHESVGTGSLWFGVLAGPIGWSVQFTADYLTDEWLSCTRGFRTPGVIWHVPTTGWIVITNTFFVMLVLFALVTSLRNFRRFRVSEVTVGERARFMAFVGIVNSVVFLFPIVMAFAPVVMLRRCVPTP
jgi:hypothetical protein